MTDIDYQKILIDEPFAVDLANREKYLTSHQLMDFIRCPRLYYLKKTGALPFDHFWKVVERKATPAANVVLFGCGRFSSDLINSNRKWYRYDLVWLKNKKVGFLNANKMPLLNHESVMEFLVKSYSDEGDTIIDPFMGSGTTGVAALQNNRRFIGIEKERQYFDVACQRIKQADAER